MGFGTQLWNETLKFKVKLEEKLTSSASFWSLVNVSINRSNDICDISVIIHLTSLRLWDPVCVDALLLLCRKCSSHYSEVEATLPRMFVWLLQLFCFMLDVEPAYLYEEVLRVERRVVGTRMPWRRKKTATTKTKTKTRPETKPRTRAQVRAPQREQKSKWKPHKLHQLLVHFSSCS